MTFTLLWRKNWVVTFAQVSLALLWNSNMPGGWLSEKHQVDNEGSLQSRACADRERRHLSDKVRVA